MRWYDGRTGPIYPLTILSGRPRRRLPPPAMLRSVDGRLRKAASLAGLAGDEIRSAMPCARINGLHLAYDHPESRGSSSSVYATTVQPFPGDHAGRPRVPEAQVLIEHFFEGRATAELTPQPTPKPRAAGSSRRNRLLERVRPPGSDA